MRIVVPMKAVPDLVEEIELNEDETGIDPEYLTFVLGEWDSQALEEALLLKDAIGAEVVAVGLAEDPEIDQILYTALAKGADAAVKIAGAGAEASSGPAGIKIADRATLLAGYLKVQPADLVISGVQAADDLEGQLPPTLGALLDLPHVSVAVSVEVDGGSAIVRQEFAGGRSHELQVTHARRDRCPVSPPGPPLCPDHPDQAGHAGGTADRADSVVAVGAEKAPSCGGCTDLRRAVRRRCSRATPGPWLIRSWACFVHVAW